MKLKESIPSNSLKIIDLYNKIDSGLLDTSPNFQRKLVWKKQHKYAFIQTILLNYPFPEVYIASAEMDVLNLKAKEIVVDGQQRLNAIVDYIKGINDFANQTNVTPFDSLHIEEKKEFLNYSVTVKDLKDIGIENIKEIFKRINSTDYSLNSNEIINAQFGDGEFAIFSKQLADIDFNVSTESTDILIPNEHRKLITSFFKENKIFSDNDIKRMFDSQYIMLISSTILEGKYFGRSSRIDYYLEKYNLEFSNYSQVLELIKKSIETIQKLKLSEGSYWFNKANLFTLIIELSKIETNIELDTQKLELLLLDLENKVDIYFNGDENEVRLLSSDETKYFEVARQGSHELSARDHRGRVISSLIKQALIQQTNINNNVNNIEEKNIDSLNKKNTHFTKLIPTETGLTKNIMDATSTVREFLHKNSIHNYDIQEFGPQNKVKIKGHFINNDFSKIETEISLYRSNGRGDFRIWFSDLKRYANAGNELILIVIGGEINVLNTSKYDYSDFINNL
jgi:hypothetical protein